MGSLIQLEDYFRGGSYMTSIFEVSNYFLSIMPMSHKKLQKLCYYAYAWYLTLYEDRLFDDGTFEAWVHGPVNRALYMKYRSNGWNNIHQSESANICDNIREFLDMIVNTFGDFSADDLENMTHAEKPWINARLGYQPYQTCEVKLDDNIIKEYYKFLMNENQFE